MEKNQNWLNNLASTSSSNTSEQDTTENSLVYQLRHELLTLNSGSEIESRDDNQILFRHKNTGTKWLLVGARNFEIEWGETNEERKWTLCGDSRFSDVAKLQDVWELDIRCTIETIMLSRGTLYGAYLLFKLEKPVFGLEMVGGVVRYKKRDSRSDSAKNAFLLHFHQGFPVDRLIQRATGRFPVKRDDGWMEIELGDFKADSGKVEARLMEIKRRHKKGGLIVEGIEFRPKTSSTSSIRRPILLSEVKPNIFVYKKTEKKYAVIGARELVIENGENPKNWLWIRPTDSRFSEVALLKHGYWLEVKCRIETRMLSPDTNYKAYLVFKLLNEYGLETVKRVVRSVSRESGKDAARRASPAHLSPNTTSPSELQTDSVAVVRDDGWMEVELGDFFVRQGDDDEVEACLLDKWTMKVYKSGLIVEAIEFRLSEIRLGSVEDGLGKRPSISHHVDAASSSVDPPTRDVSSVKKFFEDKKTRKKCAVVEARELVIKKGDNPKKWLWIRPTDSRFEEVAQLKRVYWLEIKGRIEIKMLSPETDYEAYLVFKLESETQGLESVKRFVRFAGRITDTVAQENATPVHLHMQTTSPSAQQTDNSAVVRDDGWMEVKLGSFYVYQGDEDEVEASLLDIWTNDVRKTGLIVEAIEFRPK